MANQDSQAFSTRTRRGVLTALTASITGLAGCSSRLGDLASSPGTSKQSSNEITKTGEFSEETCAKAQDVGKRLRESVVVLKSKIEGRKGKPSGTGWYLGDRTVITNGHVVKGADSVTAWTLEGETTDLTIRGVSLSPDIAVLKPASGGTITVPSLSTTSDPDLDEDQPLVHVGHPFAIGNWVIGMGRYVKTNHMGILSSVASMSGFSGSPVATLEGSVVGMTSGGVPKDKDGNQGGEAPEPVDPVVHDEFTDYQYTTHVPMEKIQSKVDEWSR